MAFRFAEFRLDGSSIQNLPDGSIKVRGKLTHPGIFSYRNPDGTERKEYRPKDEVFRADSLSSFSNIAITVNHPSEMVNAKNWRKVAIGNVGETVREDRGHVEADLYIREDDAIAKIKNGDLRHISCGYRVDYDPTPGTTPEGERYDGVQRNIRGNHVALLPTGIAPRGGSECTLRLDSAGDEIFEPSLDFTVDTKQLEVANAQIAALQGELAAARTDAAAARTDAAQVPSLKTQLADVLQKLTNAEAAIAPERLDALVIERAKVIDAAKAAGVDYAGKSSLQIKRAIVAKRTPSLQDRVDSLDASALDAVMSAYADQPHPTLAAVVAPLGPAGSASTDRADATAIPKVADLHEKFLKESREAWKVTN